MEYIEAKTILVPSDGTWFGSDFTANVYRGCSHGCLYCDSRSDCYAIKHFNMVRAKRNALSILENELVRKRKKGVIGLGSMSDSYNPAERELELTRGVLKLCDRYGFGVSLETKSDLVVRDIDILRSIAVHSPVIVKLTVTTPYDELGKKLEPHACSVKRRFAALKALSDAGIYTGILLTPILPFIEDDSAAILSLVDKAAEVGSKCAYAGSAFGVTMRDGQRSYFLDRVEKHYPGMKVKYIETFGDGYFCMSPKNSDLFKSFTDRCRKLGLKYDMDEIIADYMRPYQTQQISLFDL